MIGGYDNCTCKGCEERRERGRQENEFHHAARRGKGIAAMMFAHGKHLSVPADIFMPAIPPDESNPHGWLVGYLGSIQEYVRKLEQTARFLGYDKYAEGEFLSRISK